MHQFEVCSSICLGEILFQKQRCWYIHELDSNISVVTLFLTLYQHFLNHHLGRRDKEDPCSVKLEKDWWMNECIDGRTDSSCARRFPASGFLQNSDASSRVGTINHKQVMQHDYPNACRIVNRSVRSTKLFLPKWLKNLFYYHWSRPTRNLGSTLSGLVWHVYHVHGNGKNKSWKASRSWISSDSKIRNFFEKTAYKEKNFGIWQ